MSNPLHKPAGQRSGADKVSTAVQGAGLQQLNSEVFCWLRSSPLRHKQLFLYRMNNVFVNKLCVVLCITGICSLAACPGAVPKAQHTQLHMQPAPGQQHCQAGGQAIPCQMQHRQRAAAVPANPCRSQQLCSVVAAALRACLRAAAVSTSRHRSKQSVYHAERSDAGTEVLRSARTSSSRHWCSWQHGPRSGNAGSSSAATAATGHIGLERVDKPSGAVGAGRCTCAQAAFTFGASTGDSNIVRGAGRTFQCEVFASGQVTDRCQEAHRSTSSNNLSAA